MKTLGRLGRWLGFIAVIIAVMTGFYFLNAFQSEQGTTASEPISISTPPSQVQGKLKDRYFALSEAAEYIVYGRVRTKLAQTEGMHNPPNSSLLVPITYDNFLIDVIEFRTARGGKHNQTPLPSQITIRQQNTSNSAEFANGELFVAFVKHDNTSGTYRIVGLTAGPAKGKLSVTIQNGNPYVPSGEKVSDLLRTMQKSQ